MKLSKKDREVLSKKYNGKCAYCGCELQKGWHADHIEPCRRNSHYNPVTHRWEFDGTYVNPENDHIDNLNPSCASCNINKHSYTLEQFRESIQQFIPSLNEYVTQYKFAKRYGLIEETNKKVRFYFEIYEEKQIKKHLNHSHFWVEDGKLYESYHTVRGLRHLFVCNTPDIPDNENCSEDMIKYIEKEFIQ